MSVCVGWLASIPCLIAVNMADERAHMWSLVANSCCSCAWTWMLEFCSSKNRMVSVGTKFLSFGVWGTKEGPAWRVGVGEEKFGRRDNNFSLWIFSNQAHVEGMLHVTVSTLLTEGSGWWTTAHRNFTIFQNFRSRDRSLSSNRVPSSVGGVDGGSKSVGSMLPISMKLSSLSSLDTIAAWSTLMVSMTVKSTFGALIFSRSMRAR